MTAMPVFVNCQLSRVPVVAGAGCPGASCRGCQLSGSNCRAANSRATVTNATYYCHSGKPCPILHATNATYVCDKCDNCKSLKPIYHLEEQDELILTKIQFRRSVIFLNFIN